MLGFLSFLAFGFSIAFVVSLVLVVIRSVKKQPRKPFVVLTAVSVIAVLALSVPISQLYVPAEKPEEITESAESEQAESAPASDSVPASSENVDNSVESVDKKVASQETESAKDEQPAASDPVEKSENSDAPASSTAPADDEPDFIEAHKSDIVVSSSMVLEQFIPGYKIPLAPQLWTVAKFDKEGAVISMADVTDKSSKKTERAIVVQSPIMDGDKMTGGTPHFVSVGDVVYGDDGYCDEVFSSIADAMEMFGGSE